MSKQPIQMAVLGDPISHSKSPIIHQMFAEQWGQAIRYEAIHCPIQQLPDQLKHLFRAGFSGLNLTVPLKERALELCAQIRPAAEQAGAVNTLIRSEQGWIGTNTDGQGWVDDALAHGVHLDGQRVLMVGAGGAAAGLIGPLLAQNIERLVIMNRTLSRALSLIERFNDPRLSAMTLNPAEIKPASEPAFDVLIQASAEGHSGMLTLPDRSWLTSQPHAFDLNYGQAHRAMADWCGDHAIPVIDGLGMLVRQAALSFQCWTGFMPKVDPVVVQLRKA